ncbi:M23 family metallopeptidase [Streptomyces spongiae]|uniref:M23 family metallopeptidase n=1 Tax=Streptomyces spongiae TaxID=565072 RepID=A0A5N8XG15_9ACTN|nr:M23 family metallopeptidase [Streptomyces spongiae]MPY58411.1 M23 family metallopeptidase [Streptomyces spongiae]
MNDRHPSGTATPPAPASDEASAHYASYGHQEASYGDFTTYDAYGATGFDTGHHTIATTAATDTGFATTTFETTTFETDPLFGDLPGDGATGSYDSSQWSTGSQHTLNYDPYAAQHQTAYDTGSYDSSGWTAGYHNLGEIPAQSQSPEATGQWDANGWLQADQLGEASQLGQSTDQTQHWTGTQFFDTGVYDATQWNGDGTSGDHDANGHEPYEAYEQQTSADGYEHPSPDAFDQQATATFEQVNPYDDEQLVAMEGEFEGADDTGAHGASPSTLPAPPDDEEESASETPLASTASGAPTGSGRAAARAAGRSRRRAPAKRSGPAKRSAVLTIAVPSACVMGVAGIAAASVGGGDEDANRTTAAASDAVAVKPSAANNKLDTQLESLSAGADDFADRASRTQERIDLKAQQEAEKKRAAAEAARKERLRPKFALPVAQKGLSAYYGQSGINWMSVHTGIDFPVSYGTPVMAATDGTVRTQWNSAYGNMVIVTAKDGTETWYCHLSTYKVPSGATVKAGDMIAYSGNSGNSTGPHLHFEVHPGGGSAIDPLPWLRSHGLDPT